MSRFALFCHLPSPERSRTLRLQLSYILRRLLPSWVAREGAHFFPGEGRGVGPLRWWRGDRLAGWGEIRLGCCDIGSLQGRKIIERSPVATVSIVSFEVRRAWPARRVSEKSCVDDKRVDRAESEIQREGFPDSCDLAARLCPSRVWSERFDTSFGRASQTGNHLRRGVRPAKHNRASHHCQRTPRW